MPTWPGGGELDAAQLTALQQTQGLHVHLQKPYTAPFDPALRPSTRFLPLNEGITADNTTGREPSQVP